MIWEKISNGNSCENLADSAFQALVLCLVKTLETHDVTIYVASGLAYTVDL